VEPRLVEQEDLLHVPGERAGADQCFAGSEQGLGELAADRDPRPHGGQVVPGDAVVLAFRPAIAESLGQDAVELV
jgi:hypothetical protein